MILVHVHQALDVHIYERRYLFDDANFFEHVSNDQVFLFLDNHFEHLRRLNLSTCVGVLTHLLRDDHVLDQFHYGLKYLFSSKFNSKKFSTEVTVCTHVGQ